MNNELIDKLKETIQQKMSGHKLIIGPDYEVLDSNSDGFVSILMGIKIAAFSGDDGEYDPEPITIQFDFLPDDDEWALAVGTWGDDWIDITCANLFMTMYYQSQAPIAQQQEAEPVGVVNHADLQSPFALFDPDTPLRMAVEETAPGSIQGLPKGTNLYASPPKPAAQPVTMDDAIAAGDGTLHGAIDYWQERALKAEAAQPQVPEVPHIWVLTESYNDDHQYGDYFVAAWTNKPTLQQIAKVCGYTLEGAEHVLAGGGRHGIEKHWYYKLREHEQLSAAKEEQ